MPSVVEVFVVFAKKWKKKKNQKVWKKISLRTTLLYTVHGIYAELRSSEHEFATFLHTKKWKQEME